MYKTLHASQGGRGVPRDKYGTCFRARGTRRTRGGLVGDALPLEELGAIPAMIQRRYHAMQLVRGRLVRHCALVLSLFGKEMVRQCEKEKTVR